MLGFDKFFENKTLLYSAGAVAFLVAALLILFIFRLAFGRRLHMPGGGRARQPRLGVVDAFDLDRQRQLVLVRRDNVEHLVMIGGPNDVLIESQIVRAEARDVPRPRDKEPTVAPLTWPAGSTAPAPGYPPAITSEPKLPPPEELPIAAKDITQAPIQAPVLTSAPAVASASPVAAPIAAPSPIGASSPTRPPFLPLPPRRPITTPSFGFKPAPANAVPGANAAPGAPAVEGALPPASPLSPPPLSSPPVRPAGAPSSTFLRPPRPVPGSPIAPPVAAARPVETAPSIAPVVVSPQQTAEPTPKTMDAIESLEEEMAKLLGRTGKDA